ncbi:4-hydroxybenzoate 3-monooxygenase [Roseomonas alkaliterrae]|uniref:p-hydroxybenzoate 3-monooxygenase n=1 Tax=Neoroseomonas alkaliterrae TaxID=1452450 RepID=A0A840Y6R2_9PROT|nr:4-hydroxybenzoate 3-monooxygenase [Neoroseomonas alkaliterrae]MBB5689763.1 p-hydroxybenzoate 3-monooxygenase [Neoroseomonas alkaliterrae]MBR0674907.1 4-hydroxybenzoate 3-monooxygenase [Neoroseomonas alkaliterrae]
MRTQVGIVGAGPAGLLLARMLQQRGIESVVLEARSRTHVEGRIRAGLLEQGSVETMTVAGVAARLHREGLVHHGLHLRFGGKDHRIALSDLTGRTVTIYGQQEAVKDMIALRLADGLPLLFEVSGVSVQEIATTRPRIAFRHDGRDHVLECDVVAGCDGFHGVCRAAIPAGALTVFDRPYPFAWLGILARARPMSEELIYARHARGFALATMRSPAISRLYLQCAPEEDLAAWSDDRIWAELALRLGAQEGELETGPILQRGVTAMRSFVAEPMRHGRLFLAGDAAHIVPPTGAKGMNLAIADVRVLVRALEAFFAGKGEALMDAYSATCLDRVWKVQRFSWWMTQLLHRYDGGDAFEERLRLAELDYLAGSAAAQASLAENYVGLPYAD